jgi:TonB family protein
MCRIEDLRPETRRPDALTRLQTLEIIPRPWSACRDVKETCYRGWQETESAMQITDRSRSLISVLKRLMATAVVLLAFTSFARADTADAELAKGIAQAQNAHWDDAVSTLNEVALRLSATPMQREALAQAYLWLGIAYAHRDSEADAREGRDCFREALKLDPAVSLAEGWPATVSRLFGMVETEIAAGKVMRLRLARRGGDSLSFEEKTVYEKAQTLADSYELVAAEALLRDWMARNPESGRACGWLAEFLLKPFRGHPSRFDEGVEVAERCVILDGPKNPASCQTLAGRCWEKAYLDPSLTAEQKERYAELGLKYAGAALRIKPNLIDSITSKALLLGMKASTAKDEKEASAYRHEAKLLGARLDELRKSEKGEYSEAEPHEPRPHMTAYALSARMKAGEAATRQVVADALDAVYAARRNVPPAVEGGVTGGVVEGPVGGTLAGVDLDRRNADRDRMNAARPPGAPVRVGGQVKEPKRITHVAPVYPPIARSARVQGIVILECTISPEGHVLDAKVLRSIPLLDNSAIEAVKQWVYAPTLLNGVPVPLLMTVVVNFKLPVETAPPSQ